MSVLTFTFSPNGEWSSAPGPVPSHKDMVPKMGFSNLVASFVTPKFPQPIKQGFSSISTASDSSSNCSHPTVDNGLCAKCKRFIFIQDNQTPFEEESRFSNSHSFTVKNRASSFERELKTLQIPEDVKAKVIEIDLSAVQPVHRMGVRKSQLFSYIHAAYAALGYKMDMANIQYQLGMVQKEVNAAARIISGTSSSKIELVDSSKVSLITPLVRISPLSMISAACEKNGMTDHYPWVSELGKKVLLSSDKLLERKPDQVALAVLQYYMKTKGIVVKNFAQENHISESTLKNLCEEVARADNL